MQVPLPSRVLDLILAGTFLLGTSVASAAIIDFESIPGGSPSDGLTISTQFESTLGMRFSLANGGAPVLAQVGAPQTAFQGFDHLPDQPAPGVAAGDFFLTDDGIVSGPPSALIVDYLTPVSAASGILLDIDGSEEWTVTAFDSALTPLDSLVLPPNNVLDGSASFWSFDLGSPVIVRIRLEYTGAQNAGVGLAFDNFSPSSAVPEPSTGLMVSLGLIVLAHRRRRLRTRS